MPTDPNEPAGRRPRASRNANTGFPVGAALAVVALLGLGYFGSLMIAEGSNGPGGSGSAEAPAYVPFSSVPEESPPDISNRPGMKWVNNAPADLALSSSAFATARKLAAKGAQHLVDARSADAAGNSDEGRVQRKAAKVAYDTAFTDTAAWEMELLEAYTDKDRQVRDIQRERTKWMDRIIALHKTTGR
jgi:hypothetical protein